MNSDEFDALIRQSDPAAKTASTDRAGSILRDSESQWIQLSSRRVVVRRRVSLCLAVMGVFAMLGGAAFWMGRNRNAGDHEIAAVAPTKIKSDRRAPSSDDLIVAEKRLSIPRPAKPLRDSPSIEVANHSRRPASNDRRQRTHRRRAQVAGSAIETKKRMAEFAAFVDEAGEAGSDQWMRSITALANRDPQTQREAINQVAQVSDANRRIEAFELVYQAAGDSQRDVLIHWLSSPSLRLLAWNRIAEQSTLEQSVQLIPLATNHGERLKLCQAIAMSPEPESISVLLNLTVDPHWRNPVRLAAGALNPNHIPAFVMLMREKDMPQRTAAAFVLASVPGDLVDQVVASMILGGRYRQPAYLVLLSRDTPQARAFLASAARSPELTPALVSARLHFANIEKTLHQWIAESKGANHERSDTTQRLSPNHVVRDFDTGLVSTGREIG